MNHQEQHKAAISRFRECINTCDHALAEELIDSHAEFASLTSSETLYGGSGYLSVVELMRRSFSDIHWDIMDLAAEDDKVAVSWVCSGTHDGDFMGRAPTGKTFSFSCMNFYYFNAEGRIIRDVAAQGLAGLFAALDA